MNINYATEGDLEQNKSNYRILAKDIGTHRTSPSSSIGRGQVGEDQSWVLTADNVAVTKGSASTSIIVGQFWRKKEAQKPFNKVE